ncbi:cobalt ECF transporter T component CbiQ [Chloroflexota bacterium]
MKHGFIDQYSDLDSFIHKLDPRTKLLATLAFILAVVATPPTRWQAFACYLVLLAALILISRLQILYVLRRALVIIPFVLMIAIFIPFFKEGERAGGYNVWLWEVSVTYSGLLVLWNVVIKAWLSVLSMILLTATTPLPNLLKGMAQLKLPQVLVMILSFMYRYIFILADEAMRMRRAWESRNFSTSRKRHIRTVGSMIGTLFLRSYERGERVYAAMLARGFEGQARTLHQLSFGRGDFLYGVTLFLFLASVSLVTWLS